MQYWAVPVFSPQSILETLTEWGALSLYLQGEGRKYVTTLKQKDTELLDYIVEGLICLSENQVGCICSGDSHLVLSLFFFASCCGWQYKGRCVYLSLSACVSAIKHYFLATHVFQNISHGWPLIAYWSWTFKCLTLSWHRIFFFKGDGGFWVITYGRDHSIPFSRLGAIAQHGNLL